jgi:hypothetical protein
MAEAMKHIEVLAGDIGPRPATTDAEKRAANYIQAVFAARGLDTEVQDFDCPRTYSWSFVLYHFITVLAAVLAGVWGGRLVWPAFAVAALNAFVLAMDLETRWGLTSLMPKGPSQNVIARHVPHVRRGERMRKVIVVAHYDSARASLAFSPGMVKNFNVTFALMKACTFAVPVMIFAMALSFTAPAEPWLWYATMAVSAYLLVPLFINVHRELFMKFVDGANNNASGVAAMLSVMESIVPATDGSGYVTSSFPSLRRSPEAAEDADVIPEGAVLTYSPAEVPAETTLPDDFEWVDPTAVPSETSRHQGAFEFDTIDFDAVPSSDSTSTRSRGAAAVGAFGAGSAAAGRERVSDVASRSSAEFDESLGSGGGFGAAGASSLDDDFLDEGQEPLDFGPPAEAESRTGLLERFGRSSARAGAPKPSKPGRRDRKGDSDVSGWLGVDEAFDARQAGRKIGSWDNFDDGSDDDVGWKGGWAGEDPIDDVDFAAEEAARIRRRVTESVDRELSEKEVWFVATGAEEVGTYGMRAFLERYGDEVKDALILNIDNVGAGSLYWVTGEGMLRLYSSDRRLTGLAKRVSREHEILVKPRVYRGLSTDATAALARGFKAMSIMAFDADGRLPNWHWNTDTDDHIDEKTVDLAADLVLNMIRDA